MTANNRCTNTQASTELLQAFPQNTPELRARVTFNTQLQDPHHRVGHSSAGHMAPRSSLYQEGDHPHSSVLNASLVYIWHEETGVYVNLKCRNALDTKKRMIPARRELGNSSLPRLTAKELLVWSTSNDG